MSATEISTTTTHANAALAEADRLMVICNSCRYCEGLCAVFPAMERRWIFNDGGLNYLANLCHNCGACYDDCQFSPPHEFQVNVPRTLAVVRNDSYKIYAWPGFLSSLFARNGLAVALIAALSVALFVAGSVAWIDPAVLWSSQTGEGAFYRLMPHRTLVWLFSGIFIYAIVALAAGAHAFWRDMGETGSTPLPHGFASVWQAMKDAGRLRYLDGGKGGCVGGELQVSDKRKRYHHATFYGFLLCFLSTTVATGYHYVLGREAPYAWYDLPVLLGIAGGIGLIVGPVGLLLEKEKRPPALSDGSRSGMDIAFLWMLLLSSATGLAVLLFRTTPALGLLLAVHLGLVFSFFATMPYGKFVHGIYRYLALVRDAGERRIHVPSSD
jgi:citrate/tricarballylate utilization protein